MTLSRNEPPPLSDSDVTPNGAYWRDRTETWSSRMSELAWEQWPDEERAEATCDYLAALHQVTQLEQYVALVRRGQGAPGTPASSQR
jgi:hypothetical protein